MKKTKTTPTKEVKAAEKKFIPRLSDEELKKNKIIKLLDMFDSYPDARISVLRHHHADLIVLFPFTKTTLKTIGGLFNPHEIKKEETFCLVYLIDIIEKDNKIKSDKDYEEKKKSLEKRGIIYLKGFDINDLYEKVVSNQ